MQKVDDVHLTSHLELEFEQNGNIQHVYLFSFIAILILLIAIINFMNLSTARASKRGKEVGLRKVLGAHKRMLVSQFMGEAIMTSLLALVISVGLIYLAKPWFNELTGKQIEINLLGNLSLAGTLLAVAITVGLFAAATLPSYCLHSAQRKCSKGRQLSVAVRISFEKLWSSASL